MTVLAGGIGSRFWPVSTRETPKQLLPLGSERPLIVDTVERALTLAPMDRVRILAGDHLTAAFRAALPEAPQSLFMLEPAARGTAPVLARQIRTRVETMLEPSLGALAAAVVVLASNRSLLRRRVVVSTLAVGTALTAATVAVLARCLSKRPLGPWAFTQTVRGARW